MSYARDLCRGLAFLHSQKLVHRDLKLDNCGLSYTGQVKIFDLGSVTSEDGEVKGTILTRSPELFGVVEPRSRVKNRRNFQAASKVGATRKSDIWALGATLFALRTGGYPFVFADEIEARRNINRNLVVELASAVDESSRQSALTKADSAKKEIDGRVSDRITGGKAKTDFEEKVRAEFKGLSYEIMASMLSFNPAERQDALFYADQWSKALDVNFGGPRIAASGSVTGTKVSAILKFSQRVANHEVIITDKQRQRIVEELRLDLLAKNVSKNDHDAIFLNLSL